MKKLLLFLVLLLAAGPAQAGDGPLVLASGAGYKKMVNALVEVYGTETGNPVELVYGNMAQVAAQVRTGGKVDLVLGADFFLGDPALNLTAQHELGRGRLVLAWPKGQAEKTTASLTAPETSRIALPNTKQAIYGKAALEYLQRTGVYAQVEPKLVEVATVPQVYAYLAANEVDLGFLNLTQAMNVRETLGGYLVLDDKDYDPIRIVVCEVGDGPHPKAKADFLRFLESGKAKKILRANGL
ncbi:MAG: molybdate ABC transporter substrate-binding protein [Desulfovibrio sp.]